MQQPKWNLSFGTALDGLPPNGLALSCAALLDRERDRADSRFQNGDDLGAALRRQLQRRVGRPFEVTVFPATVVLLQLL